MIQVKQYNHIGIVAKKRVDGSDYLFCKDPDGNRVEITHH